MHDSDANDEDETLAESVLVEAIENQLEAGEPAVTQAVLNKLTLVGHPRDEAVHLMALVLADEVKQMMRDDRPFDGERYERLLRDLPDLPEAGE
ncbi:hypothetical protein HKW98_16900 [Stutzerimonas urumqiensis]|uniref:hypothetical protein n=1 Tax=Stutzerimonas urumqiensis TaxID=638269 RepID=UPI003BAAF67C